MGGGSWLEYIVLLGALVLVGAVVVSDLTGVDVLGGFFGFATKVLEGL